MKSKIVSFLIIIVTFGVALAKMANNSKKLILHWDISGNVTTQGTENLIILLPMASVLLLAIFAYFEKNPYKINNLSHIKETENNTKALVKYIQVTAPLAMFVILYITICSAKMISMRPLVIMAILSFIIGFYAHTCIKLRASLSSANKI